MPTGPSSGDAREWPGDDSKNMEGVFAEFERIIGSAQPPYKLEWVLPVTGSEQLLALLKRAPSGIGVSGLETYLREQLGTLSGLVRIDDME